MMARILTLTHVVRLQLLVVAACFLDVTRASEDLGCCPKFWTAYGSNCYRLYARETQWSEAEQYCSGMEYMFERPVHLVSITSRGEQDFVYRYLDGFALKEITPGGRGMWIGIIGRKQDGTFEWTNPRITSDYSNWGEEQRKGEDFCAAIDFDQQGKWVEKDCNEQQYYVICKFSLEN